MEGIPVLDPLEHSVLEMALDSRLMEGMTVLGTVRAFGSGRCTGWSTYGGDTSSRSVTAFGSGDGPGQWTFGGDVKFGTVRAFGSECSPGRGRPMEGIPVLEPLEHSVMEMALDSRLMEGMTVLEPLEHLVLKEARSDGPTVEMPLEHSVPDVALDWDDHSLITMAVPDPLEHLGVTDGAKPGVVPPEPLEHSVLVAPQDERDVSVAGVAKLDPKEHLGAVRRTETMSVCLLRDAGWNAIIGPSGTVPVLRSWLTLWADGPARGWRTEAWSRCWEDDLVLGVTVSASGRKYLPSDLITSGSTCDVTTDGNIAVGLVHWNTGGGYSGSV